MWEIPVPPYPATSEAVPFDGLAFKQRTSLNLWVVIAATGGALSLLYYGLKKVDLFWLDGPTRAENVTLGVYFLTIGLFLASACLTFLDGSNRHPSRPVATWAGVGVGAAFALLFAATALIGALTGDGAVSDGVVSATRLLVWNPFAYAVALPTAWAVTHQRGSLNEGLVKVAAGLWLLGVATPVCALILT